MKILLIRPPGIMGGEHSHALQHPINLCWLAAVARAEGFDPAIVDYEVTPFDSGDFTAMLRGIKPAIVGLTAMTPTIDSAARIAAEAKAALPDAATVIGGAHASILPVETLKQYPQFDVAVIGEGEVVFAEICRDVRAGALGAREIPSAMIRTESGYKGSPEKLAPRIDPGTLPLPARELLDLRLYKGASTPGLPRSNYNATQLFTARGCPGKCIFCCSEHIFGRRVAHRPVAHVVAEIRDCMERFGFNHFTIDNDTFTDDRARALEFCSAVSALGITWDCDTRVDRVDEDLLKAMAASGCVKVAFGVETGSERVMKWIKKGITLDQVRNAFRWTRAAGMLSCAFFIIGNHPDEEESDIEATRRFIREIDPDLITVAIATPYPKIELESLMRDAGLLGELPWSAYGQSFQGKPFTRTRTMGASRLNKVQSRLLRGFYLRPRYIMRRLSRIRSLGDALYWFGAGFQFLLYLLRRNKENAGMKM